MTAPKLAKASFLEKMLVGETSTPGGTLSTSEPEIHSGQENKSGITTTTTATTTAATTRSRSNTTTTKTTTTKGQGEQETGASQPAWLKGDFLTSSKGVSGWDRIAEEEAEEEDEAL